MTSGVAIASHGRIGEEAVSIEPEMTMKTQNGLPMQLRPR